MELKATPHDAALIDGIVARAMQIARELDAPGIEPLALTLDLTACHLNGMPLDLEQMLAGDDGNLGHDVFGIRRFIDRQTGHLSGGFTPRYARPDR